MNIETLAIEVTRKCGMNCLHCLRGPEERTDISFLPDSQKMLEKIFDGITSIDHLVFSGGEPSENESFIEEAVNYIIEHNIQVHGCFIATNAMKYSQVLVDAVRKLFEHEISDVIEKIPYFDIDDLENMKMMTDNCHHYDFCISVSVDEYHKTNAKNWLKYAKCGFYADFKETRYERNQTIIDRGNAYENGIGTVNRDVQKLFAIDDDYVEIVYVNVNGEIFADCDLSYDMQDNEGLSIGRISVEKTLSDILENEMMQEEYKVGT